MLAAVALSALLLFQEADDAKIGDLIRDLGAEEYSVRDKAERELRSLGAPALQALKKAQDDRDPERALRARRLVDELEKQTEPSKKKAGPGRWKSFRDFSRGLTFESRPDGSVELTVREPEDREARSYRAGSLEELKKKHPELAEKYDLDRLVPREKWSFFGEEWKKRFDADEFWKPDDGGRFAFPLLPFVGETWQRWMQDPFGAFRLPGDAAKSGDRKPALGVSVERASDALADQMGLTAGQGLVVVDVKAASPAEKAGLRRHDLLLKVNGKILTGPDELRREVEEGLKRGLEFDVLRRGKHETIKVEPVAPRTP